jgi:hypothetical protein
MHWYRPRSLDTSSLILLLGYQSFQGPGERLYARSGYVSAQVDVGQRIDIVVAASVDVGDRYSVANSS